MQRTCADCGAICAHRRCDRCQRHTDTTSWNSNRGRQTQATFRRQVLAQDNGQCTYTLNGKRCTATTDLQAHHTIPGNHDPTTGRTLCRTHHRAIDPKAR